MPKMRQIELKTITSEGGFAYADMLLSILKQPHAGRGMDYAELELIVPIRKAVREAKDGHILLSEEQHAKLTSLVTGFSGYFGTEENFQFVQDIKNAPSVEVAPV